MQNNQTWPPPGIEEEDFLDMWMGSRFLPRYYRGRPDRGSKLSPANCSKWATVTPMSALAAEVEAVEAEDMEVGLDYWLHR